MYYIGHSFLASFQDTWNIPGHHFIIQSSGCVFYCCKHSRHVAAVIRFCCVYQPHTPLVHDDKQCLRRGTRWRWTLWTLLLLRSNINGTQGHAQSYSSILPVIPNFCLSINTSVNSCEIHRCSDPQKCCRKRSVASFETNMAMWCICRC